MLIFFSTESLHPASMPFSHIQFLVDNLMNALPESFNFSKSFLMKTE